jgi:hypothetical protein
VIQKQDTFAHLSKQHSNNLFYLSFNNQTHLYTFLIPHFSLHQTSSQPPFTPMVALHLIMPFFLVGWPPSTPSCPSSRPIDLPPPRRSASTHCVLLPHRVASLPSASGRPPPHRRPSSPPWSSSSRSPRAPLRSSRCRLGSTPQPPFTSPPPFFPAWEQLVETPSSPLRSSRCRLRCHFYAS